MLRPYNKLSLERGLEGIKAAGFKYTAYLPNTYFDGDTSDQQLLKLRSKVEGFGVRAVTAWGGDITRRSPEHFQTLVRQCGVLGLEYLIVSSPYNSKEENRTQTELGDAFLRIIEPAFRHMENANVRIDVKPHMGPYGTGPGLAELAKRVNHPLFGVSYDPGNMRYYEGLEPKTDLPTVVSHVRSLCVKDHSGGQMEPSFPNAGDGDVDWVDVFNQLSQAGFSGYALVEVLEGSSAEELDASARTVYERLGGWAK